MEAQPDELQLERLLASPEALKNLPSIIADIEARKAASLAHLSDSMAGQVCASYRSVGVVLCVGAASRVWV
jgi:hypothetical protein